VVLFGTRRCLCGFAQICLWTIGAERCKLSAHIDEVVQAGRSSLWRQAGIAPNVLLEGRQDGNRSQARRGTDPI
jgi:hypothetical protein